MCLKITRFGGVACITLDRADKLNAIDMTMMMALDRALCELETDYALRAVILTGTGRAFSVGADINSFAAHDPIKTWREWIRGGHKLIDRLATLRVPTIGAINGFCFGGGLELALATDFCIADEQASFAAPEVKIGTVPGWGGSQRLPAQIGPARAKQMMFTGAPIDASNALAWGLVNEVTESGMVAERAHEIAKEIAINAPVAVEIAKQLAAGMNATNLHSTLESLAGGFAKGTNDGAEGLAAFAQKRPPKFRGD